MCYLPMRVQVLDSSHDPPSDTVGYSAVANVCYSSEQQTDTFTKIQSHWKSLSLKPPKSAKFNFMHISSNMGIMNESAACKE